MNRTQQLYNKSLVFGNFTKSRLFFCLVIAMCLLFPKTILAQEKKELTDKNESKEAKIERLEEQMYLSDASEAIKKEKFVKGEAYYRKAISINEKETAGNFNLGNAYYKNDLKAESLDRFKKAALTATEKPDRHRAFHNLGNALMDKKDYTGAVDAYKNALRNNPTDDETRYNLAVAKDLLEKNPPEDGGGDDENEDNQDKKDQQDQQDKEDKKDGDDGKDKDEQDKGDEKDKDKEGENEDKGKPDEPKDNEEKQGEEPQQQQPIPGKLSPQEVKNLLESMNNEEKKVQDKINAQKQKGAKVKSEKDW